MTVVGLRVDADAAAARLPDGAGLGAGVDGDVGLRVGAIVDRDVRLRVGRVRTRVDDVGTRHVRPVGLDVGGGDIGRVDGGVGPVVGPDRAVARIHAGIGGRDVGGVERGSVRAAVGGVVRDDDVARPIGLHVHRHVHERHVGRGFIRVRRTVLHVRAVRGRNPGHPRGRGGLIRHSAAARECGQQQPLLHQHHLRRFRHPEHNHEHRTTKPTNRRTAGLIVQLRFCEQKLGLEALSHSSVSQPNTRITA